MQSIGGRFLCSEPQPTTNPLDLKSMPLKSFVICQKPKIGGILKYQCSPEPEPVSTIKPHLSRIAFSFLHSQTTIAAIHIDHQQATGVYYYSVMVKADCRQRYQLHLPNMPAVCRHTAACAANCWPLGFTRCFRMFRAHKHNTAPFAVISKA